MSKELIIFDTTLRDGEQTPGVNLNINEKVEIGRQLEKLGVNVIEAGFAIASHGDAEAIAAVAKELKKSTVASLSRATQKDIDAAYNALSAAVSPRIHIFIATSDIHMKYKLKMSEDEVLENAIAAVKYAKKYCSNIEFSAEDAGRSRPEFLCRIFKGVIDAGATCINIPDTVGYTMPKEFGALIKNVRDNVDNIDKADVSVHCHNDLGLAVANSLEAILNGANQVECTINGLGERAGNASMEELIMAVSTRKDFYDIKHTVDTTQLYRTSRLVSGLTGVKVQINKAIVGENAFAHESGIHQHGVLSNPMTYEIMTPESVGRKTNSMVLGKLSGRHAFEEKLKELGYELDKEHLNRAFEMFKSFADKKKEILDEDLHAIVSEGFALSDTNNYELVSFQVNSGNKLIATATVELKLGEEVKYEAATGDGPVDAIFKAIIRLIGMDEIKWLEYNLSAITGGEDALGEVNIKLGYRDKTYSGRGISTDVLEATTKAIISAINRI